LQPLSGTCKSGRQCQEEGAAWHPLLKFPVPFSLTILGIGVAVAGLIVAAIALIVSLGFNYLQYKWRDEERQERGGTKG